MSVKKIWCILTEDELTFGNVVLACYSKQEEADRALAWWKDSDNYFWIEEYDLHSKFKELE